MSSDLAALLDDAVGTPPQRPDFRDIAAQGHRRRRRQRLTRAGVGLVAVVALGAIVPGLLRAQPTQVFLEQSPSPGAGSWELVPDAPLPPGDGAVAVDLGDGTVLVVAGDSEPGIGRAARYDIPHRAWTELPPAQLGPHSGGAFWGSDFLHAASTATGAIVWTDWVGPDDAFRAALFDRASADWIATGPAPLSPRVGPFVDWIDERLVVWGGFTGRRPMPADRGLDEQQPHDLRAQLDDVRDAVRDGAMWTPGDGWSPMAAFPLAARHGASILVVDGRIIVWGGAQGGDDDDDRAVFADGAVYDVQADEWQVLADAPLSARSNAQITIDGEGFVISGGTGEVTVTEHFSPTVDGICSPDPCRGESYGKKLDWEHPTDAARYDWGSGRWTVLAEPPPAEDWPDLPNGIATSLFRLKERSVAVSNGTLWESLPLRGLVSVEEDGWEPIAEADTPARHDAAMTPIGEEAVFVWGGTSILPGADVSQGDPQAYRKHADGAIWHP